MGIETIFIVFGVIIAVAVVAVSKKAKRKRGAPSA